MNSSLITMYTQTLTKSVLKEDANYRYKVDAVKKFLISQKREVYDIPMHCYYII